MLLESEKMEGDEIKIRGEGVVIHRLKSWKVERILITIFRVLNIRPSQNITQIDVKKSRAPAL
jgi:hypothetical protein